MICLYCLKPGPAGAFKRLDGRPGYTTTCMDCRKRLWNPKPRQPAQPKPRRPGPHVQDVYDDNARELRDYMLQDRVGSVSLGNGAGGNERNHPFNARAVVSHRRTTTPNDSDKPHAGSGQWT